MSANDFYVTWDKDSDSKKYYLTLQDKNGNEVSTTYRVILDEISPHTLATAQRRIMMKTWGWGIKVTKFYTAELWDIATRNETKRSSEF